MSVTFTSESEQQTIDLARALAEALPGACVIALSGPLGAGKTRFVRGLAQGLGIDPRDVSSPTFVLAQEYGPGARNLALVHVDAYRLTDEAEWDDLGLDDPTGGDAVVAVEWPERARSMLPDDCIRIELEPITTPSGAEARRITIDATADVLDRLRRVGLPVQ